VFDRWEAVIESLMNRNDISAQPRYAELIRSIQWVNVQFSFEADEPSKTGECGINMIVKRAKTGTQIIIEQCWSIFSEVFDDLLLGVLMLDPVSLNI
jgi:hypothetical protein